MIQNKKTEPKKEMTHSHIGASIAERWMNCPSSVVLNLNTVQKTSIYAAEGIAAHELAEAGLKKGMKSIEKKEGDTAYIDEYEIEITEEMIEAVRLYVDTIYADADRVGIPKKEILTETKFLIKDIPNASGTNDACIYDPFNRLTVYDFKYGAGEVVEVVDNKQLMYYGLGAIDALNAEVSEIELVIIQPRARHEDGPVRRWLLSYEQLLKFKRELKEKASIVEECLAKKDLTKVKSGKWCKWCGAQADCSAIRREVTAIAKADFTEISSVPPAIGLLSLEDKVMITSKRKMIDDWLDSIYDSLLETALSGVKVPGHKLVKKKANRVWTNPSEVEQEFSDLYGEEIYKPKELKTPAQLEKLVGKQAVADYTETPDKGLTLVAMSDKREEVSSIASAIEDFS